MVDLSHLSLMVAELCVKNIPGKRANMLKTFLPVVQSHLHPALTHEFEVLSQDTSSLSPVLQRYILVLQQYCSRTGKAIRPLLVATGAAWSQAKPLEEVLGDPRVVRLMVLVELNHVRLLLADDVADRDEQRHGGPSFHIAVAEQLATHATYQALTLEERVHIARSYTEVMGILLQQLVNRLLIRDALFTLEEIEKVSHSLYERSYMRTVSGWFELFEENYEALTGKEEDRQRFLKALEEVTGEYTFMSPLLWGAALGERYGVLEPRIIAYGEPAGVVFQLSDDVIGLYGDPVQTGKPVGNDLREGKKTLFIQYAWLHANEADRKHLQSLLGNPELHASDVAWVRELIHTTGADALARQELERAQDAAVAALDGESGEVPDLLREVVQYMMSRQS